MIFSSCDSKAPVISSINPKVGRMGEIITLEGNHFGDSQEDSFLTIAGIAPTASSYYLWQDNLIMVRVPELGESGLVYVHTNGKRSNGVLYSNIAAVPQPVDGQELGLKPRIDSVSPQSGAAGTIVTIAGNNFGGSREGGGVFFTWNYSSPSGNPYSAREPEFIEVSEMELGFISWNSREITVRIPDGAVRGNLEVRTAAGKSLPVFFDASSPSGSKVFSDKRSYTISVSVDINVLEATRPNSLYLWMPRPVISPSQRNVKDIAHNTEPFIENHRGVNLYKLENLTAGSSQSVTLSFQVDVYAAETQINPALVRQNRIPLSELYTQSSPLINSDDPEIKTSAAAITGREQNPYYKARLIYNWIISNNTIEQTGAAEGDSLSSYSASILYAAMLRASGIACIPVAGVLVNGHGPALRHFWTEFWLDDFGWVPVDIVMGAEAVPQSFLTREDNFDYYFGNIDNRRIAFSRGEVVLSQMESRGRLVSHNNSYSLQNIWEEASGGLDSYSSLWGDVTVTGIYVQ